MKKTSTLALVLIVVSILIAALTPKKHSLTAEGEDNGTLQASTHGDLTCIPNVSDSVYSCNVSNEELTTTTHEGQADSFDENGDQTENGTSQTNFGGSSVV